MANSFKALCEKRKETINPFRCQNEQIAVNNEIRRHMKEISQFLEIISKGYSSERKLQALKYVMQEIKDYL